MPSWTPQCKHAVFTSEPPEPSITSRLEWVLCIDTGQMLIALKWREIIWNAPSGHVTFIWLKLICPVPLSVQSATVSHHCLSSSKNSPPVKSKRKISRFRKWMKVRIDRSSCTPFWHLHSSFVLGKHLYATKQVHWQEDRQRICLGKQQNPGAKLSLSCPLSSSSLVAILFILIHFLFRESSWAGPEGGLTNLSSKHNCFLFLSAYPVLYHFEFFLNQTLWNQIELYPKAVLCLSV